jgi:hypothetical protein
VQQEHAIAPAIVNDAKAPNNEKAAVFAAAFVFNLFRSA